MGFKKFFERAKAQENTIYGFASVIGTLITLVYTGISAYKSQWSLEFHAVVVALSLILFFLCILFFSTNKHFLNIASEHNILTTRAKHHEDCLNLSCTIIHNLLHESRALLDEFNKTHIQNLGSVIEFYKSKQKSKITIDDSKQRRFSHDFEKFMIYLLDNTKSFFDSYTNESCNICIKLIDKSSGPTQTTTDPLADVIIKTYLRDSISYRARHQTDIDVPQYRYHENTAFKKILDNRTKDSYYLSNCLSEERDYQNLRDDWKSFYNATLVVPIRKHVDSNLFITLGFLCVDNFNGGFTGASKDFFGAIADHLFNFFSMYNDVIESFHFLQNTSMPQKVEQPCIIGKKEQAFYLLKNPLQPQQKKRSLQRSSAL